MAMTKEWKKALFAWVLAAAAVAEAVLWTLFAAKVLSAVPVWWGTGISVVAVVVSMIFGKPWTWPSAQDI